MAFYEITPYELGNASELVGKDMMLITVEDKEKGRVNAMTASWGSFGVLWNKNIAVCFIRQSRYTYPLAEESERFSLAFFGGERRDALAFCGKVSGRDTDKLVELGFHTEKLDGVSVIEEAKTVVICRKLYTDMIDPSGFEDKELFDRYYSDGDLHRVFVCEIEKVYTKKEDL